ncbi:lysophospholipid acyltransferase family protein [Chamaesiphon sp. VAR_48_metabat_135_sub]|uniref:lysophospholipid acyltransferase family protein n=1 Tax=Chamaesiphon sp. VAR_48_metabat_135_sub TaxID=2964699 RepID=UPI00286B3DB6|nr:lysophospholipid acyltransferase family protein [Chamaesiphon sp. VAR_48_metabat_135_sub]
MNQLLRLLFFGTIVRLVVLVVIGLRITGQTRLPRSGPAIICANHNSHLDTLVLMTIFPLRLLAKLRPVAAAEYFLKNRILAWFALHIIGIIPLQRDRSSHTEHPLAKCSEALERGEILIIYPEGSRGEPESLASFHSGIAHLAKRHPNVPIYPVFIYGLGKVLPKGEKILVPFFCDLAIGEPIVWSGSKQVFMDLLHLKMQELSVVLNWGYYDL